MNGLWRVFRGLPAFAVELGLRLGLRIDERLSRQLRFPVRQLIHVHIVYEHTIRPAPAEKYGLIVRFGHISASIDARLTYRPSFER